MPDYRSPDQQLAEVTVLVILLALGFLFLCVVALAAIAEGVRAIIGAVAGV